MAGASADRRRRAAQRGAHAAGAGTDRAGDTLATDHLDTEVARVKVIDVTVAMAFRAGLLGARPCQACLPHRRGRRRRTGRNPGTGAGPGPRRADYGHSTPPDRAGARRGHRGGTPPRRSVITVSTIVAPPHRLHAIAMSRLRLSLDGQIVNAKLNLSRTHSGIEVARNADVNNGGTTLGAKTGVVVLTWLAR